MSHHSSLARGVTRVGLGRFTSGTNPHGSMSHHSFLARGVSRMGLGRFISGTNPHGSMVDHRIRALLVCGRIPL
jgi:hypothetical protein